MIPFIVFDTEITGLGDDAGICEIAIHGIDNDKVANAPMSASSVACTAHCRLPRKFMKEAQNERSNEKISATTHDQ